ncbi:MAG: roadblock/LC7 domain-containing protein [Pseudomonadota bacterium]
METREDARQVGRHLTSAETVELARIQKDPSVIGYAVLDLDGNQIEASGVWASQIVPVFANVFDLADRMGGEFGEEDGCPVLFMESPDFEVAGLLLTSARAVIIKRKPKRVAEGLRSVE